MYPEYNFAVVKLQSEFLYLEELDKLNNEYKLDPNYSKIHYLVIIIDEKSRPNFKISDLGRLSKKYNTEPQENNHKSVVWVVSRPIITALAHLFILKTKDNSSYCSTTKKAYRLLEAPFDYDTFSHLIETAVEVNNKCDK